MSTLTGKINHSQSWRRHEVDTASLLQVEWNSRGREVTELVRDANKCTEASQLLAGDFNTMSHLDGSHPWPVTAYLEAQGFEDAYRVVYPNHQTHPGLTWFVPLARYSMRNEVPGRLDFCFVKGVHVMEARV